MKIIIRSSAIVPAVRGSLLLNVDAKCSNSSTYNKSVCDFTIKTVEVIAVVEMESLFSTSMFPGDSIYSSIIRPEGTYWNRLDQSYREFCSDFQELTISTTQKIDKIEWLILENVAENERVEIKDIRQQIEFF